jgi:hypothetical protein
MSKLLPSGGNYTVCGYEVSGMSLLHDLQGPMGFDCSKDMSMHVSTCTIYNFSALMPVIWKVWR